MSYHLTAFELTNQLLYIFQASNVKCFRKIGSLRCRRLLRCDFVTSVIPRLQRTTDDINVDFRSFRKILRLRLGELMYSS